jgi:DNA-binding CsgD family transcriptional regulator
VKSRAHDSPGSVPAFVLIDSMRVPIYANAEAMRILGVKRDPAPAGGMGRLLGEALWTLLPAGEIPAEGVATSFLSGRRRYSCRVTRLNSVGAAAGAVYLLMIDHTGATVADESYVVERYSLTHRETELLRFLMTGLTNKEIGDRMQISPNTVKAFLKLMMTKMGVSTRAAVVGRAFEGRAQALAQTAGR